MIDRATETTTPAGKPLWFLAFSWCLMALLLTMVPHVARAGYASMVVDYSTGQVLNEVNADEQNHPASLTKMMTLYLTFEALRDGRISLYQQMPVSLWAANKSPTKLGLLPGQTISVHDCILGMVTKSANDAATVMAEGLGGTESHFAEMMNAKARQLGMTRTNFRNASGLPDMAQWTTAHDYIRLSIALYRDFPEQFHYFSVREFVFRGQLVRGHNHLMERYAGMDGIKTGYTAASGFNLASTATRDGRRLFGVVMGGNSHEARDNLMETLLDNGFANRPTDPLLIARAAGVPASIAARQLAGIAVPSRSHVQIAAVSPRHRRDRHGPVELASAYRPVWSIRLGRCGKRAEALRETHTAARLAHLSGKPATIIASGHHRARHGFDPQFVGLSQRQAQLACRTLLRKGENCVVIPPTRHSFRVASE